MPGDSASGDLAATEATGRSVNFLRPLAVMRADRLPPRGMFIVHHGAPEGLVKETARRRVEIETIPMSADQIKDDALFVYETGMALFSFLKARNLLPPFPTALRPRRHKSKEERKKRRERKAKP
jgi:hypothetical protein